MEEKNIVLVENEGHVRIEDNKKRQGEKIKRIFVRCVIVLAVLAATIIALSLLPRVKEIYSSFLGDDKDTAPSTDTATDTNSNENSEGTNQDTNQNQGNTEVIPSGSYLIKEASNEYKITNESGCEFDFTESISPTTLSEIYSRYGSEAPVVLITHSNKRECYSNGKYYFTSDNFYSDSDNVGQIGALLTKKLNDLGINAIHLDELYASGSIINSSDEYEDSLASTLKKYPSISYVFNISRGVYINDDMSMQKELVLYQDKSYAQLLITSGTGWDKASENQTKNVLFALDFASFTNSMVSNLISENRISRFDLSQNIAPYSMNIEIGSFANSFSEANESCELFATVFYEYLTSKSPT